MNLLLRLVGTTFQVYISSRIGAGGIGLLQLTLSVGSLSLVAGTAGVRTAAMYLTAEELGRKGTANVRWVLSGCFLYSILCSSIVAFVLYYFAPILAESWIGDYRTVHSLRLFACFLPCTCLCGVMTGYFTAANRIGTLAVVEVLEQLLSMAVTILSLTMWAGTDAGRACQCVILGSGTGAFLTLILLVLLRMFEHTPVSSPIPLGRRLANTAVPLALADVLKSGINTTENLMVPKRLEAYPGTRDPLAAFGMVSGMVFPVLMFPACILFALAELLIPELARCSAAGSRQRIRYLVRRGLKVTMLYGVLFSGLMFLLADRLCLKLYDSSEAGYFLKLYAPMIPMLYCDAITDAMVKGLGQQKICVRYNILTSAMDVLFLYFLLPDFGMMGYLFSFLITHLINFILSLRRLLKITGQSIPFHIPCFTIASGLAAAAGTTYLSSPALQILSYCTILFCLLFLMQVISREDLFWLKTLVSRRSSF